MGQALPHAQEQIEEGLNFIITDLVHTYVHFDVHQTQGVSKCFIL